MPEEMTRSKERSNGLNLVRLRVLTLIEEGCRLSEIADHLSMTQPAVSFHMKKLEEETGLELYHRVHQRVLLTDAGKGLAVYAQKMSALSDQTIRYVQQFKNLSRGQLTIGSSHVPAAYILPHLIGSFRNVHPDIYLQLKVKTSAVILSMLRENQVDLAFLMAQKIDDADLEGISILEDELMLILPPSHALVQKPVITVADLQKETLILHDTSSTTRILFDEWMKEHHLLLQGSLELGSAEALKEAVEAGLGISVLSSSAVKREVKARRLVTRPLPKPIKKHAICLVYLKHMPRSPAFNAFIEMVCRQSF
ncbi:LysR substrate-binding domain-containing protein [Anoxynatronum buryatiense]|uniref:Transcriptional regulator, LysR family n=1 Tax=Anoxynatronum buryatiense TaxID=489973 RepID=A0AA45WVU3_9CLOT|nr:LysR substrate-binding domain-containing protein [Anoxynatronum buryatiense]SMP55405.1 transcriptional regulator, LysR family [Anoxynatronum buryatiense]